MTRLLHKEDTWLIAIIVGSLGAMAALQWWLG